MEITVNKLLEAGMLIKMHVLGPIPHSDVNNIHLPYLHLGMRTSNSAHLIFRLTHVLTSRKTANKVERCIRKELLTNLSFIPSDVIVNPQFFF